MLKKPPSKVAQKNSNPLFSPYCQYSPNGPKQTNSCFKMWPIDQLYIELGLYKGFFGLIVSEIYLSSPPTAINFSPFLVVILTQEWPFLGIFIEVVLSHSFPFVIL